MKASFLNGTSWAAAFKEQWRNLYEWLGLRAWCTKCSSQPSMPYVLIALCSDVPSAVRTMWAQFRLWPFSSSPPCRCQVIQSWGHLHCAHTVLGALWQQQAEPVTLFWEHSLRQLHFCPMIWTWRQRGNPEKSPGDGVGSHQAEVMFAMTWAYFILFLNSLHLVRPQLRRCWSLTTGFSFALLATSYVRQETRHFGNFWLTDSCNELGFVFV